MSKLLNGLLPFSLAIASLTVSVQAHAEASKKTEASTSASKAQEAKSDDFEENRRLHMSKSKENNQKKGAE